MREIKFRAWHKADAKMYEVQGFTKYKWLLRDKQFPMPPGAVIIMQFTGLFDKNEREIYEGDVYHQGDPKITYTVVWADTGLKGKQNGSSSYAGLSHWADRIEVIGNIHEKPELLNS